MDPLDGFRGRRLTATERQEADAQGPVGVEEYQRYVLAQSAIRFMTAVQTRPEDLVLVGKTLVERCEERVRDAMRGLLELNDPSCEQARVLHYEARVHGGMLALLNEIVESGLSAGRALEEEDE